jgi:hypothetical protein
MPYRVREVQPTPNPNAAKFVLDQLVTDQTMSFRQPEQAKDHSLAKKLFAIQGVSGIMLLGDFITVTKTPEADWKNVSAAVKTVLESA